MTAEDGPSVARELLNVFRERGRPKEVLFDNGASFKSDPVRRVCDKFGVKVLFRCAYRPSGNGVVERNHRTIKRTAARAGIDPLDAAHWYNLLPRVKDDPCSVPSAMLQYRWRFPGVCQEVDEEVRVGSFLVGETVYVKPPQARCFSEWREGVVTKVNSSTNVEIDGVPRHVGDIRRCVGQVRDPSDAATRVFSAGRDEDDSSSEDENGLDGSGAEGSPAGAVTAGTGAVDETVSGGRPRRTVRRPDWLDDYVSS